MKDDDVDISVPLEGYAPFAIQNKITGAFGAYWAPKDAGFGFAECARAYLGSDGTAKIYGRKKVLEGGQWKWVDWGSTADQIEWGKSLDPEIRKKMEDAIIAEMTYYQRKIIAAVDHQNGPRDDWGNLIADCE